jgi:hypothetical protein
MPDALSWSCGTGDFDAVHGTYMRLLENAWTRRADGRLCELRAEAGETAFNRFLGAPETSRRLLWPGIYQSEAEEFFDVSLRAEIAFAGGPAHFGEETWTALGDAALYPGGERFVWPQEPGMMPLDFGSPRARKIDLTGAEFETETPREPYSIADLEAALRKVREALRGVSEACPEAGRFIAGFNKILVIQPDPAAPRRSSSGSNGQFVGRSFVTNVQSPDVTPEAVADAVVHEGIHGVLYMQQVMQPWGPSELVYNQVPMLASPWTGRILPLRSFVEACFVWYGLLHFWCHALSNKVFECGEVRHHLSRALKGFLGKSLSNSLDAYRDRLMPDLFASIAALQTNVQAAFAA